VQKAEHPNHPCKRPSETRFQTAFLLFPLKSGFVHGNARLCGVHTSRKPAWLLVCAVCAGFFNIPYGGKNKKGVKRAKYDMVYKTGKIKARRLNIVFARMG